MRETTMKIIGKKGERKLVDRKKSIDNKVNSNKNRQCMRRGAEAEESAMSEE